MTALPRGLIYLASPYSSPYGHERAARYKVARRAALALAEAGEVVFSPVAYGHLLADGFGPGRPAPNLAYWMQLCLPILAVAQRLYVLTTPGWNESRGVREEVQLAARLGKPILGYNPFGDPADDVLGSDIRKICALPPGYLGDDADS